MHKIKRFLFTALLELLLAICYLSPSFAQDGWIFSDKLDNDLEVIVVENHSVPLATISMAVKNGAFVETPEFDGLSHLYEHMFFKANRAIPNQEEYMKRLRELGACWNGWTSTETVNYFFTMPKDNLKEGLEFMNNAIRFPLFDQEEMEREREVILSEYDINESDPYGYFAKQMGKKLWFKYYSRKNVIGDRQVIATATKDKMLTTQKRYYIPNNCALIVGGDVSPEEVFSISVEFFGD